VAEVRCRVCGEAHDSEMRFCPRATEPTAIWDGPCGTKVDRYYVEKLLGGGGMGAVYFARHVHLEQPVALKLLKANLAASRDMVERFVREAKAAAAIGNPHIIRVSDFGITSDGRAFLAMELLDGRDLDHVLASEKTLAPARAARIALQVLDGLGAAHAAGIVHRDLKPANIFLLAGDQVRLVDFGVSKVLARPGTSSLTQTGMVMGTPMYMAPEQFKGAREVDGRADLYAVGVTLYQMLSGAFPYDAQTYESLILQIYTEPPKPLSQVAPGVPGPLAQVVERAMAREPERRYANAREFADALRATMAAIGESLPPAPPPIATPGPVTPFGATAPQVKPKPAEKKKTGKLQWVVLGLLVAGGATTAGVLASRRGVTVASAPPPAPVPVPAPVPAPAPVPVPVPAAPDAEPDNDIDVDKEIAAAEKEVHQQIREALHPPPPKPGGPHRALPDAGAASARSRPEIDEPEIVGDLSSEPLRDAAKKAKLDDCRRDQPETVVVQFHVAFGKVGLSAPAPKNAGDVKAARCVASRIKEQGMRWKDDENGILFLEVRLPAKK
jgi:eukaryotic-like serine/threonine-protein kinase